MAATATTLRLAKKVRAELLKVTDGQARTMTKAWVDAWDAVAGDLELAVAQLIVDADAGTVTQAQALRSSRLQKALELIGNRLTDVVDTTSARLVSDLPGIVRAAGEAQEAIIASQLPKDQRDALTGWDRVDPRQVEAIVQRSTQTITSSMWPISAEADAVIRRELVRGIASGLNPRAMASRMVQGAEGGFNGGLTRALNIARTEALDAHRAAAKVAHDANSDVLAGWIWLTSLSSRVCPACLGMSGTEHPLSEPGPDGHQSCRCSRMPKTKTWRELGIDIDEPAPVTPDAGEWFSSQDVATQKQILGPARYAAWKRGDYPMSKWAVARSNEGWRRSYVTSPLPKSA